MEKQTSIDNMIWPCPKLYWDDDREDEIPEALSCFYMDDAWNGGNSIRISISCPGSEEATAAYRTLWLPIQSLHLISQRSFAAHAIFKSDLSSQSFRKIQRNLFNYLNVNPYVSFTFTEEDTLVL